jgi:predicted ATPase
VRLEQPDLKVTLEVLEQLEPLAHKVQQVQMVLHTVILMVEPQAAFTEEL